MSNVIRPHKIHKLGLIPDNVTAELVVDFDYMHPPGLQEGEDVYVAWKRLHDGPDIVWTPHYGGHWIVTRGEDVKFVQEKFEIFSHEGFFIPREMAADMPPLTVDPPVHARYRAVLNPYFTPSRVKELRRKAQVLTKELVAGLQPKSGCDFVNEFARVMPVNIFLGLVDLPLGERAQFVDWAVTYISTHSPSQKEEVLGQIVGYLGDMLDQRLLEPGDDLYSHISQWRSNPRCEGRREVVGMALVAFLGGLDTVANVLSFTAAHLATHPEHRKQLIERPDIIPCAAEEFIRRFGLSNTGRLVKQDFDYKGVHFKTGDMVLVSIPLSSIDDRLYDRPMEIDFDRRPVHNTFSNGPHKCVGSGLARAEIVVFLEEWLRAIPEFRLDPDRPPVTHSGSVNGMHSLHLVWES